MLAERDLCSSIDPLSNVPREFGIHLLPHSASRLSQGRLSRATT
jgi:hypothetical protein